MFSPEGARDTKKPNTWFGEEWPHSQLSGLTRPHEAEETSQYSNVKRSVQVYVRHVREFVKFECDRLEELQQKSKLAGTSNHHSIGSVRNLRKGKPVFGTA
jgi:hypothetical protein